MKLGWGIGLGLFALVAVGCDVSVCTKDVDGKCFDFPDLEFDGGIRFDASVDSGARSDGQVAPADGAVVVDGSSVVDGGALGIDGGQVDGGAGPTQLSIEDFCDAEYKTAKAWRDRLEQCCTRSPAVTDASELLLANSFFYGLDSTGKDSVEKCIDGLKASAANLTYVPAAAPACAAAYNAQFTAAPAACPAEGFAVEVLESSIGHMAASLNQLPECRAAIVGKIARDATCGNSFECQPGLRCLVIPGGGAKSCRPPLDRGNPCTVTSECADGLVCMGLASGSGGRVCYAKTEPLEVNSACDGEGSAGGSTECRTGLICLNNKCSAPQTTVICKQ
jgi:hypothetical protein